eukprot:TRINITY_DN21595_c0_g1_i2.p1 TRINITY_DN21595_c0_g1~~TRINITY_DN21595_c0_g1_i2.p1  ORF type:complete len:315 (+),score=107.02 TRINITY_DN21595_c0_g1_i2:905-1849(+)
MEAREEATDAAVCAQGAMNAAAARIAGDALAGLAAPGPLGDVAAACVWAVRVVQTNSFECESGAVALHGPPLVWVNHSCCPNACRGADGAVRCVSPIPAGAEILISYIPDLAAPRRRRRAALRSLHGFTCECSRCAGATAQSPCLRAVRCRCGTWASPADGADDDVACAACGGSVAEAEAWAEGVVERAVQGVLQGIDLLGGVDDELLGELRSAVAKGVLHPLHWASQRIHAALAAGESGAVGAAHALTALAGLHAAYPALWPGKAEAAERALARLDESGGEVDSVCAEWIRSAFTRAVLEEEVAGQRRACDGK